MMETGLVLKHRATEALVSAFHEGYSTGFRHATEAVKGKMKQTAIHESDALIGELFLDLKRMEMLIKSQS